MVRLTEMVKTSGCAAKLSPSSLERVLSHLPMEHSDKLLGGFEHSDDALVYDMGDGRVSIQSVDFFPPMVDDPYTFGQIAAANALSDIYAMGAYPAVAMNLVCFPSCLDLSILEEILKGGLSKLKEAGCALGGGHTISDPTPKYGLCVSGFAAKKDVWTNRGAKEGDVLILTKKIGVGALNTAIKAGMCSLDAERECIRSMTQLNKAAMEAGRGLHVHAATDITGFSLLGHSKEMADASGVTLCLESGKIPILEGALESARFGLLPEGMYNNREFLEGKVCFASVLKQELEDLLYDPQTSGGLLLSLPADEADSYLSAFPYDAKCIGYVQMRGESSVLVF